MTRLYKAHQGASHSVVHNLQWTKHSRFVTLKSIAQSGADLLDEERIFYRLVDQMISANILIVVLLIGLFLILIEEPNTPGQPRM